MNAQVNELQVLEQNVIVAAFAKRGGTDELYERIAQEVRSHVPDVSTKKGRDAIGSLALKISKSKTLIEKCGKELVAEQKLKSNWLMMTALQSLKVRPIAWWNLGATWCLGTSRERSCSEA